MTVQPYIAVLKFASHLVEEAKKQGLSPAKPICVMVLGDNTQVDFAPQREVTISYSKPEISKYDFDVWINPLNNQVFRSNPYTMKWEQILNHDEIFINPTRDSVSSDDQSATSQPVDTLADLLAINTTSVADKTMVYVEAEKAIYALDTTSTEPVSSSVLAPNIGPGRWYVITTQSGTVGNIDGGVY